MAKQLINNQPSFYGGIDNSAPQSAQDSAQMMGSKNTRVNQAKPIPKEKLLAMPRAKLVSPIPGSPLRKAVYVPAPGKQLPPNPAKAPRPANKGL